MRDVGWLTGWSVDADCCRVPMVANANWIPETRNQRSQASACQRNAALSTLPAGCRTPERTRAAARTLTAPQTISSVLVKAEVARI